MTYSLARRNFATPIRVARRPARASVRARTCCDDCSCAACPDCPANAVRRMGMGNWLDDAKDYVNSYLAPQSACIDEANLAVSGLDAKINSMAASWNPTGIYRPSDMATVLQQTLSLLNSAITTVGSAPQTASDSAQMIQEAIDQLSSKVNGAAKFSAASMASNATTLVDASDFKDWVIKSMLAVSSALVTADVMECNMDWLTAAAVRLGGMIDSIWAYASHVGSELVDLGKAVLKVPGDIADLLDKALKVGLVVGGGYLAYLLFFEKGARKNPARRRRRHRRS